MLKVDTRRKSTGDTRGIKIPSSTTTPTRPPGKAIYNITDEVKTSDRLARNHVILNAPHLTTMLVICSAQMGI